MNFHIQHDEIQIFSLNWTSLFNSNELHFNNNSKDSIFSIKTSETFWNAIDFLFERLPNNGRTSMHRCSKNKPMSCREWRNNRILSGDFGLWPLIDAKQMSVGVSTYFIDFVHILFIFCIFPILRRSSSNPTCAYLFVPKQFVRIVASSSAAIDIQNIEDSSFRFSLNYSAI